MLGAIGPELVVGKIYEAASDPLRWRQALEAARDLLHADAMLLVYGNHASGRLRVIEAIGFDAQTLSEYAHNHLDSDEMVLESLDGPAGVIVSSGRSFRGKPFFKTSIFRHLLHPSDLRHVAGGAALNTQAVHASLWMARSDRSPDFSVHDFHQFNSLMPHVTRVMTVHHRIQQAESQAEMAVGAFDRVAVGVVLLDVRGAPVMANREAERIAEMMDGFTVLANRLAAGRLSETEVLRDLVRRVCASDPVKGQAGGGAVRLSRPSRLADYHVVVLPLPRRCQPEDGCGASAVLFITDPEREQDGIDQLFRELYALTDAETRLVSQLLEGGGLTSAAKRLGLSRNTVHSQLASVFQKTGTSSQSQLLTLLLTSVAPVEGPHEESGYDLEAFEPPGRH